VFECHPVRPTRAILLVALVPALALPAAAGAATLTVDKSCYREGSEAVATGLAFNGNSQVTFTLDGQPFTDPSNPPTSDAAGTVNAQFRVGSPPGRQRTYVLAASDGTNTAETNFTATDLDVAVNPRRGNPGRRKRVRARGFDQGRILRFHVRGPRTRNGAVGRVRGTCGKVNRRVRIFRATYPSGIYTVQFDQRRRYSPSARPRVVFQVTIFRTSRSSLAATAFSPEETWTPLD
jgi:hypothetical protein